MSAQEDLMSVITDLMSWHKNRVDNCQLIIDKKEADITLRTRLGDEHVFAAQSQDARFIRIGVMLELDQFTPFPVTIRPANAHDEDADHE